MNYFSRRTYKFFDIKSNQRQLVRKRLKLGKGGGCSQMLTSLIKGGGGVSQLLTITDKVVTATARLASLPRWPYLSLPDGGFCGVGCSFDFGFEGNSGCGGTEYLLLSGDWYITMVYCGDQI